MKLRFAFAALAATGLGVSACTPTVPVIPVSEITGTVNSVIADAQSICGIEASYSDVATLLGAFVPGVDTALTVANSICAGVNSLKTSFRYRGVGPRAVNVYFHDTRYIVHIKHAS